ncbi:MAG: hypothetical protein MUD01_13785 [Chloroflexaceae bacterium]|jgi:hypothetical protein|nr:hypothetical protein [Chloroflexaceae bacterium]
MTTDAVAIAVRDSAFASMFRSGEKVWLVHEARLPADEGWLLEFVRLGPQGRWMRQRYRYDAVAGVVHFRGETPVADEELPALRRNGRRVELP